MVCQAAIENRLDIEGTHFFVGGELLTKVKRQQMESTGALVNPKYAMTELGYIGLGCPANCAADDIHLLHDSVALIQHHGKVVHADIHDNAFMFTCLSLSAPKILLNVESDDYGVMENRSCGCLLEQLGFTTHINNIRSYSKITGSGMTIVDSDFVRILEEVLPHKYGGVATDYQLLEEEDQGGQTQLSLIINPTVGKVDDGDVISTVLSELRRSARSGRQAAGIWSEANLLQVKRVQPISSSGKILPLHLMKKQ